MPSSPPVLRNIGFRQPRWSSFGAVILSGIVDFMRGHEYWRLVTENNSHGEMETVKLDADWEGDGLILFRATERELEAYRKRGQAVVLTSTEGPDGGFPRVVPDNPGIGRLAADHLLECSVPHFAFLARGETLYAEAEHASGHRLYSRERLQGYRARLKDFSQEPTVHYLSGHPLWLPETWRAVQAEVMDFLQTLPSPCGLFVADDALGAVTLRAADALGRKVPESLAVIGFGDDPAYCFATLPALSTIVYPAREAGRQAAELLWRQMNGQPFPAGRTVLPVGEYAIRESTDTLAIPDPEIRALVRLIRLRAPGEALLVSELAEHSGLSLTTIKARFAKYLGHGPKQEIQRVRLTHLQHLLRHTTQPLTEIARRMKFGSAHELSRFFLTETGQRPGEFRKV
ncbi:MAG: substrate-binding domain-containing protein [Verrucomicrobiota bacterium]